MVRFETEPDQQMQVDFTTIRRDHDLLKDFVVTLGYLRTTHVRFYDNERTES